MARKRLVTRTAADGLPEPLRWRPVVEAKALFFGVLFTLGGLVLLQQLGATSLDGARVAAAVGLGLLIGVTVPSLGRLWGIWRVNKALRKARADLASRGGRA